MDDVRRGCSFVEDLGGELVPGQVKVTFEHASFDVPFAFLGEVGNMRR